MNFAKMHQELVMWQKGIFGLKIILGLRFLERQMDIGLNQPVMMRLVSIGHLKSLGHKVHHVMELHGLKVGYLDIHG